MGSLHEEYKKRAVPTTIELAKLAAAVFDGDHRKSVDDAMAIWNLSLERVDPDVVRHFEIEKKWEEERKATQREWPDLQEELDK
ncbi:MAG: hypothetical protein AAF514_12925, partial [Verrucomicrobiota bacterium]